MKRRKYYILTAIVVVFVVINLPAVFSRNAKSGLRDMFSPFGDALSTTGDRISDGWKSLTAGREEVSEKEDLLKQNAELSLQVQAFSAMEEENAELRKQLNFMQKSEYELVLCKVVVRGDTAGWWESLTINRGTEDGITGDLAVIVPEGLVGRTMSVSRHTCGVLLLTDPNCRVTARILRTDDFGIVAGRGPEAREDDALDMNCPATAAGMEYLSQVVSNNDQVVTSGLGGVFPPDILVGYVDSVSVTKDRLYRATIIPAADLQRLRYVFVVIPKETGEAVGERKPAVRAAGTTEEASAP
jgi:rod shape-determining protein MreC